MYHTFVMEELTGLSFNTSCNETLMPLSGRYYNQHDCSRDTGAKKWLVTTNHPYKYHAQGWRFLANSIIPCPVPLSYIYGFHGKYTLVWYSDLLTTYTYIVCAHSHLCHWPIFTMLMMITIVTMAIHEVKHSVTLGYQTWTSTATKQSTNIQ